MKELLTYIAQNLVDNPDQVEVYEQVGDTFTLSSAQRVRTGYTLTGYYDAKAADGGRIRVIIARAK